MTKLDLDLEGQNQEQFDNPTSPQQTDRRNLIGFKRLTKQIFQNHWIGKVARVTAIPVVAASAWALDNLLEGRNISPESVLASMNSSSRNVTSGEMSSQAVQIKSAEVIQRPTNPITFTLQGKQYTWYFDNASFGIPPNDPNSYMGTDYVSIDGVYKEAFQLIRTNYTETVQGPGIEVYILGHAVDIINNKGYVIGAVSDNRPGYAHPKGGEIITDLANPNDWTKRVQITNEGLPLETFGGDAYSSFIRGLDTSGAYLEVGVQYTTDPTKNGKYRLRLDTSGIPIGIWVQEPLYRIYIPAAGKNSTY